MGYYSDVRAIIYGPPEDVLAFWTKHKLSGNPALNSGWLTESIDRYTLDWQGGISVIDLEADGIKWYPDIPEVAGFMRLIDLIDADDEGTERLTYEYVEIGENNDDLTMRSGGADIQGWLYVSRTIGTYLPPKLKEDTNE